MPMMNVVDRFAARKTGKASRANAKCFIRAGVVGSMEACLPVRKGDGKPLSRARHGVW